MKQSNTQNVESNDNTAVNTPQTEHLENSPTPPNNDGFSETTSIGAAEAEFNQVCNGLKQRVQMTLKSDFLLSKKNPLRFWQSLAFILRSNKLYRFAISSFVDKQGDSKLYIASDDPMNATQQQEITDIINMFLDLKPVKEIATKLYPRHYTYIKMHFDIITDTQRQSFAEEVPTASELLEKVNELSIKRSSDFRAELPLEDVFALTKLISDNQKVLKDRSRIGTCSKATMKMARNLLKMIRLFNGIYCVWKAVSCHQQDQALKSLKREFQFISLDCHAELAIAKVAKDQCVSRTLYIGVSKRPCYCCSLFFEAVNESKSIDFNVSIVPTNGKLWPKWNRIENCFDKEFIQVWAKVMERKSYLQMIYDEYDNDFDNMWIE